MLIYIYKCFLSQITWFLFFMIFITHIQSFQHYLTLLYYVFSLLYQSLNCFTFITLYILVWNVFSLLYVTSFFYGSWQLYPVFFLQLFLCYFTFLKPFCPAFAFFSSILSRLYFLYFYHVISLFYEFQHLFLVSFSFFSFLIWFVTIFIYLYIFPLLSCFFFAFLLQIISF